MKTVKRARLQEKEAQSPKEEKEPKLKCHEMRLIFQRLPTSELIRFISRQPKHPLGQYCSQELKFILEKRLPFSIKATATTHGAVCDHVVIFDCNGSRVGEIKRPMAKHFHLSPVCELIESAELPVIISFNFGVPLPLRFIFPTADILSTLTNLDTLVLSAYNVARLNVRDPVDLPTALNPEVMSGIKSLTLADSYFSDKLEKSLPEIISRATSLKKLSVPYVDLRSEILLAVRPHDLPRHYSGLESLSIKDLDVQQAQPVLEIITTRFNGLRELFLPVRGTIRQYLAAFQALPNLTTLGLDARAFRQTQEKAEQQMDIDENDPIVSVTELLIACWSFEGKATRALLVMLSKFPNVQLFSADFDCEVTDFASAVCAGGVFTRLQALKLFCGTSLTRDALLQFVRGNIDHLPSCVDISQVITDRPANVDREFLVDICVALQRGRVTSLALKDLVHRDAVPRLREHSTSTKQDISTPQAKVGKILTWIDEGSIDDRRIRSRTAGWPAAVSDFTDFRIEAFKTSGPLKGSSFKVRISDWTEKRERLFEVYLD